MTPPLRAAVVYLRHARDLPNEVILSQLRHGEYATLGRICDGLAAKGYRTPIGDESVQSKLVLAKLRRLINAGKIRGCTCGCRGDFILIKNSSDL